MLQNPDEHNLKENIRECHQHAEDCARKADPKIRQDYLECEQRRRSLARSYELSDGFSALAGSMRSPLSNHKTEGTQ